GDLARTGAHRAVVAARRRAGVADEVLEGGVDTGRLETADVGRADGADEVRVLPDRLLHPPPAGVADDVEHRGQALVDPELAHRVTDRPGGLLDERGVEGRPPGQRGREGGGLPGGEPGEALLVDERGDPEPGLALEPALLLPQPAGPLRRVDRPGAVDPRVAPDAITGDLRQAGGRCLPGAHLGLHRRHGAVLVEPVAHELGELLLQAHLRVEVADALGDRRHGGDEIGHEALSFVRARRRRRGERACRGGWVCGCGSGQPLTAPVRPPTIRFSKNEKKMSAGIIDSEVNASTRAVSTEYSDENAWTPSGRV